MSYLKKIEIAGIGSLGILLFPKDASACLCFSYTEPFLEVAQDADLVVRGVVHHWSENLERTGWSPSVWLEVDEVFYGEEQSANLRVWVDDGASCRPWLWSFSDHARYVMALYAITPEAGANGGNPVSGRDEEEKTDYVLYGCDAYHLEIVNKTVTGNISLFPILSESETILTYPEPETMSIEELREAFFAWPEVN